jgi:hypothetical protein
MTPVRVGTARCNCDLTYSRRCTSAIISRVGNHTHARNESRPSSPSRCLDAWSRSLAARADLPRLVASLIRSSCPTLQSYRFPSGDASQIHGFDGVADVVTETTFVPSGRSIVQFGNLERERITRTKTPTTSKSGQSKSARRNVRSNHSRSLRRGSGMEGRRSGTA